MQTESKKDSAWATTVWARCEQKLARTSQRLQDSFPFVSLDGTYRQRETESYLCWWTNGFWPGMLWLLYRQNGVEDYANLARSCESKLDAVLHSYSSLDHDIGFLWSLTSVAAYKLTGSPASRSRALLAASVLASRYNADGRFIRAWNSQAHAGKAIVDCLMNLPILYWASEQTGDPRFAVVAREHAATAMRHFQRPDGSMNHAMVFDPSTGVVLENLGGQGFAAGSSWSRGQAWALYGFALCSRYSGNPDELAAAKRVAHYFIANIWQDWVPAIDFRSPVLPATKDSSAAAIAAVGLLEIASQVGEHEQGMYHRAALQILHALNDHYTAWDSSEEGLLLHGSHAYFQTNPVNPNDTPLIYGDYFFMEAIARLCGQTELFW